MQKKEVKFTPLSGGYMISTMLGFLISVVYVWKLSPSWGLAFAIAFAVMFIASLLSMTYADPDSFVDLETTKKF